MKDRSWAAAAAAAAAVVAGSRDDIAGEDRSLACLEAELESRGSWCILV